MDGLRMSWSARALWRPSGDGRLLRARRASAVAKLACVSGDGFVHFLLDVDGHGGVGRGAAGVRPRRLLP